MLDRAITEAIQASAMALSFENRFLSNLAVIPDMYAGTVSLRIQKVCWWDGTLHNNSVANSLPRPTLTTCVLLYFFPVAIFSSLNFIKR